MADRKRRLIQIKFDWERISEVLSRTGNAIKWPMTLLLIVALFVHNADRFKGMRVNSDLVIRYGSAFSWPLLALLVILALWKYIPDIMKRGFEAAWGKGKITVPPAQEPAHPTPGEKEVLSEVDGSALTDRKAQDPKDEEILEYQLEIAFLKAFTNMYGTQIDALQRLAGYPKGLPATSFEDILRHHQSLMTVGKPYMNVLDFMGYLMNWTLVDFNASTNTFFILPAGRAFLDYLEKENILTRRNGL